MLGLFHIRCRNARKGNHHLLFLHGRIQTLLVRHPDAHVIIKPHGVSSEDPLKDTYPLQLSEKRTQTRRHVKTALVNGTRGGRMFNPSLPGENLDAQAESTDGRATLYMDDEIHMFGKGVIKKNSGGF
jgi:hypothetical protein